MFPVTSAVFLMVEIDSGLEESESSLTQHSLVLFPDDGIGAFPAQHIVSHLFTYVTYFICR